MIETSAMGTCSARLGRGNVSVRAMQHMRSASSAAASNGLANATAAGLNAYWDATTPCRPLTHLEHVAEQGGDCIKALLIRSVQALAVPAGERGRQPQGGGWAGGWAGGRVRRRSAPQAPGGHWIMCE